MRHTDTQSHTETAWPKSVETTTQWVVSSLGILSTRTNLFKCEPGGLIMTEGNNTGCIQLFPGQSRPCRHSPPGLADSESALTTPNFARSIFLRWHALPLTFKMAASIRSCGLLQTSLLSALRQRNACTNKFLPVYQASKNSFSTLKWSSGMSLFLFTWSVNALASVSNDFAEFHQQTVVPVVWDTLKCTLFCYL